MDLKNVTTGTLVRFLLLLLALINQGLTIFGANPIPIDSEELESFLSLALTIIISVWAFWKNNSFTKEAIEADKLLKQLKESNRQ